MQAVLFIMGYTVGEDRHDTNYLLLSGKVFEEKL